MSLKFLSKNQLHEVTGKDRRTIDKRLAGVAPHANKGKNQLYLAAEVIPLILAEQAVAGFEKKLKRIELETAEEQLQKLKLANGKTTGELVPVEDVAKVVEKQYSFVRAKMRALPSSHAKPLSMMTDPNEVHTLLREVIDECLAELTADDKYERDRQELESAREATNTGSPELVETRPDTEPSGVGGPEEISQPGGVEHTGAVEDF